MRDGRTGSDPYPEEGAEFRRDVPAMIELARRIVLAPAPEARKYSTLCHALANVIVYLAEKQ